MMTKKEREAAPPSRLILAIPLAMVIVLLFSCKDRSDSQKDTDAVTAKTHPPLRNIWHLTGVYGCVKRCPSSGMIPTYAASVDSG
ncbi:MAG: hypothetical protein MZV63_04560 [Marinilabiliales bacterium]|nr:hypothetical protein [Marinilabiliales bacterium]